MWMWNVKVYTELYLDCLKILNRNWLNRPGDFDQINYAMYPLQIIKSKKVIHVEEDKIWDKAWRAQQAHVHGPKEGRAHSLCGAPDKTKAQTCLPRFRFLKTCSTRRRLALQGKDLGCKERTYPTRIRLGLQGKDLSYKDKICSARIRLALQGKDLGCKERTCPTRIRLALQGKEARPHYYKSPNILLT